MAGISITKQQLSDIIYSEDDQVSKALDAMKEFRLTNNSSSEIGIFRANLYTLQSFIKRDIPHLYLIYVNGKKLGNLSKTSHVVSYACIAPFVIWKTIEKECKTVLSLAEECGCYWEPKQIDFDSIIIDLAVSLQIVPDTKTRLSEFDVVNLALALNHYKKQPDDQMFEEIHISSVSRSYSNRLKVYFRFNEIGYGSFYKKGGVNPKRTKDYLFNDDTQNLIDTFDRVLEEERKRCVEKEKALLYPYPMYNSLEKLDDKAFLFLMHLHKNCSKYLSYDNRDDRFFFPLNYSNTECCRSIHFYIIMNAEKLTSEGFVSLTSKDIKRLMKKKSKLKGTGDYNSASINSHLLSTFRIPEGKKG